MWWLITHPVLFGQGRDHRSGEVLDEVTAQEREVLESAARRRLLSFEQPTLGLGLPGTTSAYARPVVRARLSAALVGGGPSQRTTYGGCDQVGHEHILCTLQLNLTILDLDCA